MDDPADSWEQRGVTSQGEGAGSLGGGLQQGANKRMAVGLEN